MVSPYKYFLQSVQQVQFNWYYSRRKSSQCNYSFTIGKHRTPDFADRTAISLRNLNAITSVVIVDGVEGTKYEYEFENTPRIGIDLPFNAYRMLLGANKKYETVFNQILSSFKFLKRESNF